MVPASSLPGKLSTQVADYYDKLWAQQKGVRTAVLAMLPENLRARRARVVWRRRRPPRSRTSRAGAACKRASCRRRARCRARARPPSAPRKSWWKVLDRAAGGAGVGDGERRSGDGDGDGDGSCSEGEDSETDEEERARAKEEDAATWLQKVQRGRQARIEADGRRKTKAELALEADEAGDRKGLHGLLRSMDNEVLKVVDPKYAFQRRRRSARDPEGLQVLVRAQPADAARAVVAREDSDGEEARGGATEDGRREGGGGGAVAVGRGARWDAKPPRDARGARGVRHRERNRADPTASCSSARSIWRK